MWASLRSSEVRNARGLLAEIDDPALDNGNTLDRPVRLLGTDFDITGRISEDCVCGGGVRVWPNSSNLRLRRELPNPKIPSSSKHSGAERIYIRRNPIDSLLVELGSGLQGGARIAGGVVDVELVVVDYCDCTVCLYCEEREV